MTTVAFLAVRITGDAMAISWSSITGQARSVQNRPLTPDGLRRVLTDFPGDPDRGTYDPDRSTRNDLATVCRTLRHLGPNDMSEQAPTLLAKLRGHHRATIICY